MSRISKTWQSWTHLLILCRLVIIHDDCISSKKHHAFSMVVCSCAVDTAQWACVWLTLCITYLNIVSSYQSFCLFDQHIQQVQGILVQIFTARTCTVGKQRFSACLPYYVYGLPSAVKGSAAIMQNSIQSHSEC